MPQDTTFTQGGRALSRDQLAALVLDSAHDMAVLTTDLAGVITSWNPGAEKLLGWTEAEAVGGHACMIFTPEDEARNVCEREMQRAQAAGRADDERWHRRKDGSEFFASGLMMLLEDGLGREQIGYLKILRDRTPQHRAEEQLRRLDERHRTMFGAIDVGFCVVEVIFEGDRPSDYRFIETNRAFSEQTGLVDAVGNTALELVPNLEQHWFETYGRVALTGEPVRFENGSPSMGRWFDVHALRVGDPGERRVAVFFNDITARRRAETRLTLEVERQRISLQQMPGFVAILSGPEHEFTYVNDAYTELIGAREFVGLTVREALPEVAGQGFFELLDRVYTTGEAFRAEAMPIQLEQMAERFLNFIYQPLRDEAGAVIGIFAGGYDVTDLVQAERRVAQANATLEQRVEAAVRDLSVAEEALRQSQKMEAVGQLTGGLAHDFNNLLAGISGSLELIQTRIGQGRIADVERYVTAAQGAARRAAALTHRLLAFSRRQTLDPRPTNVNQLVFGMEELIRRTVGPAIELEVVGASGVWTALVDPPQLENALLNLCINARDAMPEGGRITIETANKWLDDHAARKHDVPTGQFLSISVTDTGMGMTPEVSARVFDPFFTTKPLGEGTGLGLSMIYGFAKQSGGQVRIYSEVGSGTTVRIYLPRHYGAADEEPELVSRDVGPRVDRGETVLVVDDEPTVRMLVAEVLEDLGYRALEAGDSGTGLKILQSDARVDLLVTDVGLPGGMNGRQMADAARTSRPDLKVLFITGYAENAVVGNGHLEPGMAVMTKPFTIDAMASRIRSMITGKE